MSMLPGGRHALRMPRPTAAFITAAALTVGATLTAACRQAPTHEQGGGPEPGPAVAVATAPVTDGPLAASFEAGGVVRARTTATIAARVMAPVLTVTVKAGDRVRRGATLVTLDAREMTAQAARGRSSVVAADEAATAAAAHTAAAEANVTLARATFERVNGLHAKSSATTQELDQATAALRAAEAQLAGAQAQTLAARAARDAARAGADAADIGLSYTVLTAPFDGIVAARHVDPGALAAPGMPLLILEQDGSARLEATLDESRAGRLQVGQTADVQFDDDRTTWQPATVAEIGRLDAGSHSFLVKLDVSDGRAPRNGSFGRARFAGEPRQALTVPVASLVRRGQLAFVYVIDDSDDSHRARLRPVTPGPSSGDRVEVLAGLTAGETVVTSPPPQLRDGTPTTATAAPRAAVEGAR